MFDIFSYQCGGNYHAPTDCETIKRWLTKCADDSETANYISAHTKDVSFPIMSIPIQRVYHKRIVFCSLIVIIFLLIHFSVQNVIYALKKMVVVIICNATIANMTSVGCVWETGKHMDQNITNVQDIKKIRI